MPIAEATHFPVSGAPAIAVRLVNRAYRLLRNLLARFDEILKVDDFSRGDVFRD